MLIVELIDISKLSAVNLRNSQSHWKLLPIAQFYILKFYY